MDKALLHDQSCDATETILFVCMSPRARSVSLLADFNGWDRSPHPMRRQSDGSWTLQLPLTAGHHLYLFLVDGKTMLDPEAMCVFCPDRQEKVSLIAIS